MSATPGPWLREDRTIYVLKDGRNLFSATIQNDNHDCPAEELEANARLIAAAPELLAACQAQHRAIDWLFAKLIEASKTGEVFLPSKSPAWEACLQGNAAIARAEGRA